MSSETEKSSVLEDKISPSKSEDSGNVESSPEIVSPTVSHSEENKRPVATATAFMPSKTSCSEHSEIDSAASESSWSDIDTDNSSVAEVLVLDRLQIVAGLSDEFVEQVRSLLHAPDELDDDLPADALEAILSCVETVCENEENREVKDTLKMVFSDDNIVAMIEKRGLNNIYPFVEFYIQDFIQSKLHIDPLPWDSNGYLTTTFMWQCDEKPVTRQYQLLNLRQEGDEDTRAAAKSVIVDGLEPNQMLWFHSTDEHGVTEIVKHGIVLGRGKRASNFGSKSTFYLTDCLVKAIDVASNKFPSDESVYILVFSYAKDCPMSDPLKKFREDGLDLTEPTQHDRLRKIVAFFGNKNRVVNPKLDTEGITTAARESLQFILGPYCSFAGQGGRRTPENVQIETGSRQLCLCRYSIKTSFEECMSKFVIKVTGTRKEELHVSQVTAGPRATPVEQKRSEKTTRQPPTSRATPQTTSTSRATPRTTTTSGATPRTIPTTKSTPRECQGCLDLKKEVVDLKKEVVDLKKEVFGLKKTVQALTQKIGNPEQTED